MRPKKRLNILYRKHRFTQTNSIILWRWSWRPIKEREKDEKEIRKREFKEFFVPYNGNFNCNHLLITTLNDAMRIGLVWLRFCTLKKLFLKRMTEEGRMRVSWRVDFRKLGMFYFFVDEVIKNIIIGQEGASECKICWKWIMR